MSAVVDWSLLALGGAFACLAIEVSINVYEWRKADRELRK